MVQSIVKIFVTFIVILFSSTGIIYAQNPTSEPAIRVNTDGNVSAQIQDATSLYLGGDFSLIGIDAPPSVSRNNFVEVALSSKTISSWNPSPNGSVEAIVVDPTRIFIGGTFSQISGLPRNYFAFYNKESKELADLNFQFNQPVYALALDSSTLYIGGEFTTVNGKEQKYLTSLNLQNNTLNTWNPDIPSPVREITIEGDTITILTDAVDDKTNQPQSITINRPNQTISATGDGSGSLDDASDGTQATDEALIIDTNELGFQIPTLSDLLTFAIRIFFVIAGLAALFYLLMGAFAWVTSGGDKDNVQAARDKIQAAIVGVIMMIVVLAIVWTLEQVIFRQRICFGISCPVTVPSLLEPTEE